MEQQILVDNETHLDVHITEQPLVSISEPIQTEVVALSVEEDVKVIHEESAVLLVLTEGGSLYKKAVQDGYSGTELEWMTELLDSKASVQFVTTTIADSNNAYALALLALKAEVGDTYATNTHLSEVIAQRDLARALDKQVLVSKIDSDILASNQVMLETMVTRDQALSQNLNLLSTNLGSFGSRVSTVEQSITNETSARTLAMQSMSSSFNNRIDAELVTVNQTFVDATGSYATQLQNINTSFNNLLNASINTVNQAITTETQARASQIETLRVDFTSGLSAAIFAIQQVEIDIDGNTTAIDLVTGQVNNPTTGLNAAFTRANQAYTLADNTAGSLSTISGIVQHPTTGLAATYAFAQQVEINANNNTASSINSLRNEITAPNASWTANNTFIQSIQTTAGNALTNAATAQTAANNAATAASTANTELAAISSDSVLSKGEKPAVVLNVTNILNEQAGIVAEAVRYGIITPKTNYTTAVSNLTAYLATLTPAYSDVTQNTPIVANTFKDKFADVYTKRQILLDAIVAAAKTLADNAQNTADNAVGLVTTLENNLESTVSGYIANNSLVLQIQDDLAGNINATSTLSSAVSSLDAWKTSTATVQLDSHTSAIGTLESRAFIGVTSTAGGKATVAGLTISSVNYSLSFQGDIFELVNTAGVPQLYYNTADGVWNFAGSLVAASFKTATSGYRVEMDGTSAYPLWFGTGIKNNSNARLYVDILGNAHFNGNINASSGTLDNVTINNNCTVLGTIYAQQIVGVGTDSLTWNGSGATLEISGTSVGTSAVSHGVKIKRKKDRAGNYVPFGIHISGFNAVQFLANGYGYDRLNDYIFRVRQVIYLGGTMIFNQMVYESYYRGHGGGTFDRTGVIPDVSVNSLDAVLSGDWIEVKVEHYFYHINNYGHTNMGGRIVYNPPRLLCTTYEHRNDIQSFNPSIPPTGGAGGSGSTPTPLPSPPPGGGGGGGGGEYLP